MASKYEAHRLLEARQQRHIGIEIRAPAHPAILLEEQPGAALAVLQHRHQPPAFRQLGQKNLGRLLDGAVDEDHIEGSLALYTLDQPALHHFNLAYSIRQQLT